MYKPKRRKKRKAQAVFSCVHCDFKALKRAELKNHKQSVHGLKKQVLQCDQCEKSFNKPASLRDHKLFTHEGFKFKCKLCDFQVGMDRIIDFFIIRYQAGFRFASIIYWVLNFFGGAQVQFFQLSNFTAFVVWSFYLLERDI